MSNGESPPGYYFSLLRLMATFRGGSSRRSETNNTEAWIASVAIYLISYLFFTQFVPETLGLGIRILLLAVLIFPVWIFSLVSLFLNSLLVKLLHVCGLFRALPARRAQSILVSGTASLMSFQLLQGGGWRTEIAAIWLIVVAMNLAAAVILLLRNGDRSHS